MMDYHIIDIFRQALYSAMVGVVILVLPGLVVGLLVAVIQAATQINEATLSFLPKLLVILVVVALFAPWFMQMLTDYTRELIINIPQMIE